MNQTYTIKNFRVFDEQGATFEMAPVTILTGCNSSGKSSVTKSLMLLNPLMRRIKECVQTGTFGGFMGTGFHSCNLDFAYGNHKLGTFEKVINWDSKEKEFSIVYSYVSLALNKEMDVRMTFVEKKAEKEKYSLRAQLKEVEISSEGKTFYHYSNVESRGHDSRYHDFRSTERGVAYIDIASWKQDLINGLRNLENGYLCKCALDDIQADHNGYGYETFFHEGDWESIQSVFGEQGAMILCLIYDKLKIRAPYHTKELCKKFKWENCIKRKDNESYGEIDWDNSHDTFEFPHQHLLPLRNLMDTLDGIAKDAIESFVQEHIVDKHQGEWFNTPAYRECVHSIFAEYIHSSFEKFSEFYTFYENAYLEKEYVYFGTECERYRTRTEGHDELKHGTACYKELVRFPGLADKWEDLSNSEKFYRIFWCLQGDGGYEDMTVYGGPEISFPLLDVIREFATLSCAEAFAACDLISESEFIEIDRANTQRIYSFSEQGTKFNEVLSSYYNLPETIEYNKDYYDYKFQSNRGKGKHILGVNFLNIQGHHYTKKTFTKKWLQKLTNCVDFDIERAPEGVGHFVFLYRKTRSGKTKRIALADMGFGTTPLLSMLLRIEVIMCNYLTRTEQVTICVEEPESNLHPSLQSQLAEMFADAVELSGGQLHFVLETHSEYLVRKSQVIVAEKANKEHWNEQDLAEKCPFKVYYLPRVNEGKPPYEMKYRTTGGFVDPFGYGFFDEAAKWDMVIIQNEMGNPLKRRR